MPEHEHREEERPRLEQEYRRTADGKWPEVVVYHGEAYDARETGGGLGLYRMTREDRLFLDKPSYIKVDAQGFVVETIQD